MYEIFISSQISPASMKGLRALSSLGFLQHDDQLASAVMQELLSHMHHNENLVYCATLTAAMLSSQVTV